MDLSSQKCTILTVFVLFLEKLQNLLLESWKKSLKFSWFSRIHKFLENQQISRESTNFSKIDKFLENRQMSLKFSRFPRIEKKSNCMQTVKTNNAIVWQTKSNCMQTVKTNNPIGVTNSKDKQSNWGDKQKCWQQIKNE